MRNASWVTRHFFYIKSMATNVCVVYTSMTCWCRNCSQASQSANPNRSFHKKTNDVVIADGQSDFRCPRPFLLSRAMATAWDAAMTINQCGGCKGKSDCVSVRFVALWTMGYWHTGLFDYRFEQPTMMEGAVAAFWWPGQTESESKSSERGKHQFCRTAKVPYSVKRNSRVCFGLPEITSFAVRRRFHIP